METNEKKNTFSFLEFAAGTNFPTDTVNVYTDADAAYQISKLEEKANAELDSAKVAKYEKQIEKLRKKFDASKVKITMRGISARIEEKLNKEADEKFGKDGDENEKNKWYNSAFVASHIVSVTNADGDVDDHKWTAEDIDLLFLNLTPESIKRIVSMTQVLTLKADLFENVEVNPDF